MFSRLFKNPRIKRTAFFFPFQLVLVHLKKNFLLLIFWLLLILIVVGTFGEKYGVPYLLLYPEYLGKVNFMSFFLLGFSCGGFIMAFNITSYIMHGFRFPFLATVSYPFTKYCLNNFIFPLTFLITYLICLVSFHLGKEYSSTGDLLIYLAGFFAGLILFIFFSLTYFISTNKDIFKIFGLKSRDESALDKKFRIRPVRDILHKNSRWRWQSDRSREWYCSTYLTSPFKVKLARDCEHYDRAMLNKVFYQNHVNAAMFEILAIISLLLLGLFREYKPFMIPAGATLFLLLTMLMMLSSAIYSWFRGWSNFVFVAVFLVINLLSKYEFFRLQENVYGMNYDLEPVPYNNDRLFKLSRDTIQAAIDKEKTIEILERWKQKATTSAGGKPPLIITCASGGGLRASLWTYYSLNYIDSVLQGNLMKNTALISGSSGGMIGAAYLREVYLRSLNGNVNFYDQQYHERIGRDLLNPVAFTIATNDLFFRFQRFEYNGHTYTKDRAYSFEHELNYNTEGFLDKPLIAYREPEAKALIPMAIFTPTIINDGRRLVVGSQDLSYMTNPTPLNSLRNVPVVEDIEFRKYFSTHGADSTRYTSLLRMNATFPYIFPIASMPSEPSIEIMDGGIRDNYGLKSALRFLFVFRDWLKENTSEVIIIQVRDKQKIWEVENNARRSILQSMTSPLGSFYVNFDKIQNFSHDELLQYASLWYDGKVQVLDMSMENEKDKKVSMSWHLTAREKQHVFSSIWLKENQENITRLKKLFEKSQVQSLSQ